jgi:hypothetical protein
MQLDPQPVPSTRIQLPGTHQARLLQSRAATSIAGGIRLLPPPNTMAARALSSHQVDGSRAPRRPPYNAPLPFPQQGLQPGLFDLRRTDEVAAILPLNDVPPENYMDPAWLGLAYRLALATTFLDNERIRLSRQVGATLDRSEGQINGAIQAVGSELSAVTQEFQNQFDQGQDRLNTMQSQIDHLAKGFEASDKKIEKLEKDVEAAREDTHKLAMRNATLLIEQKKVTEINERLDRRLAEAKHSNGLLHAAIQRARDGADVKIDDSLAREIQSDEVGLEIDRNEAEELAIAMSSFPPSHAVGNEDQYVDTHGGSHVEYHLLVSAWKGEAEGWRYVLEEDLKASEYPAHAHVIAHLHKALKGKVTELPKGLSIIFRCNRRDIGDHRFYWKGQHENKLVEAWTRKLVLGGGTSQKAWMKAFVFPTARKVELLEKMIEDEEERAGAAAHPI